MTAQAPRFRLCALVFAAACAWAASCNAAAESACVDPGGIGGTGAPLGQSPGGMGGTGDSLQHGVGGTGAPARGIGGTGAVAVGEGIGGTGAVAVGEGIGGTGAMAASEGIGGTGAVATREGIGGTGIVGTITGFASICVNGLEVHFEDGIAVTENGLRAGSTRLAVGQVVAIDAGSSARGLEARTISILHAYEGPVTALATGSEPLRVMGQPVWPAAGAVVAEGLRPGEPVRVSGLRDSRGQVVATRIDRAPDLRIASATGAVAGTGDILDGLALLATSRAPALDPGRNTLVRGHWTGERLVVTEAHFDPDLPFAGRADNAIVEGLIHTQRADSIAIAGFTASLEAATEWTGAAPDARVEDRRVRLHGTLTGPRELRATRVEFLAETPPEHTLRGRPGQTGEEGDEAEERRDRSDDDAKARTRSETETSRETIERRTGEGGEVERERIERRVQDESGELERRERIEIRRSGDAIEIRERIETFDAGERIERIERIDRPAKPEKPEKPERPERLERPEKD